MTEAAAAAERELASVAEILEETRSGRMVILVDDEDRENEGDLVIPAQWATPDAINFMAKHGRGLICLAMERRRIEQLGLPLMAQSNSSRHGTAFTLSIEAKEGVTTGISAADRARTVQVASDPAYGREDLATPGHVFPLVARDGGVLVRAGHTEAAVDIARMAGLRPAGVICEIMSDDGTMMRLPELVRFAQFHGLKIGTIADLIAYRRTRESLVERRHETRFSSTDAGDWRLVLYANTLQYAEHVALVKGDVDPDTVIPVRMHALSVLDDVLGDAASGRAGELQRAMAMIDRIGHGVVVVLREPRPDLVSARLGAPGLGPADTPAPDSGDGVQPLRDYGVGAQILLDLGVRRMELLSNTEKAIVGLDGYGLAVEGRRPIPRS